MSLENTLREMLSEGSPFIKRPGEIKPSPIKPSPNKTPKSTEEKPSPTRSASGPGVDYTPTRKGLKEFYKARLEGALLGESKAHRAAERSAGVPLLGSRPQSHRDAERAAGVELGPGAPHEISALEGARREGRLDRIAAGILAGGVAAGGFGVGNLAADSLIPTDVATHNAEVAAGEVVPPKGVSIGQVRATAEPLPQYGAFQRGAIAARAKGNKGK
jgi:hypothetical protein